MIFLGFGNVLGLVTNMPIAIKIATELNPNHTLENITLTVSSLFTFSCSIAEFIGPILGGYLICFFVLIME